MSDLGKGSPIRHAIVLSRGLLLFWSGWFSVVLASNLTDGLRQAGVLPTSWQFASGNFAQINEAVGIYSFSKTWAPGLFCAVVFLQLADSLLFWRAFLDPQAVTTPGHPKLLQAFCVALSLFAALLVADEIFIVYARLPGLPTTHLLVMCALLLSLAAISLLREGGQAA